LKLPSGAPDQIFGTFKTVMCFLMWCALSDKRTGMSFAVSAVILGSYSCGIQNHILLSKILESLNLKGQVPGTGWPGYTLRHSVPYSSSPTTRRASVELFEPASSRSCSPSVPNITSARIAWKRRFQQFL
jgi:hypothetical protein